MSFDPLDTLSRTKLLKEKISNLDLHIQNSSFNSALSLLHFELEHHNLDIKPKIWASNEWFCPDGHTSFAIPFSLLHPRLIKLEKEMGFRIEGESFHEFMKLARHECGHVMDNAYGLRELKSRENIFGSLHDKNYPTFYSFKKHSKKFVRHLSDGYAQSHPEEDWAETFAVWLDVNSNWRQRYASWQAIEKLLYVDKTMKKLKKIKPFINDCELDSYKTFDITFNEYFKIKREQEKNIFNRKWLSDFVSKSGRGSELALEIVKNRRKLINKISKVKKLKKYDLNYALSNLELNARRKDLRIISEKNNFKMLVELTQVYSDKFLKEGKHRILM